MTRAGAVRLAVTRLREAGLDGRARQRVLLAPARARARLPVVASLPAALRAQSAAACGVCCRQGASLSRWSRECCQRPQNHLGSKESIKSSNVSNIVYGRLLSMFMACKGRDFMGYC